MKILLTAIGKRVQLIQHLKRSFEVVGVDRSEDIAAKDFVDSFYRVPKYTDNHYIQSLIDICKKEGIECLIPLYEKEFILLTQYRSMFEVVGTRLLLSSTSVVEICNDKIKTSRFFKEHQINHPKYYENKEEAILPVIIKPIEGMGSQGIFKAINQKELDFFSKYEKNSMIEECIEGEEYTIDVLCDLKGKPIYIVPRIRIEVRSGEVSKSQIVLDKAIIKQTEQVLSYLNTYKDDQGRGIQGPMTLQCFKNKNNQIIFLEINPRFGGGVPLSFEAGADYGVAIQKMLLGEEVIRKYDFLSLKMLRYDQAIFK